MNRISNVIGNKKIKRANCTYYIKLIYKLHSKFWLQSWQNIEASPSTILEIRDCINTNSFFCAYSSPSSKINSCRLYPVWYFYVISTTM
jgi:hypothetical protein